MFFFQAEDGIRDLVRSRGLGDVYKRQVLSIGDTSLLKGEQLDRSRALDINDRLVEDGKTPVSYTHLTLPTSDLV